MIFAVADLLKIGTVIANFKMLANREAILFTTFSVDLILSGPGDTLFHVFHNH